MALRRHLIAALLLAAACNGTVDTGSSPAASRSGGAPPDGGDASAAEAPLDASSGAGPVADGGDWEPADPMPPAPAADAAPTVPRIPGVEVTRRPGPYREIAKSGSHTCAIRLDGTVDCWAGGGVAEEPCPDPTSPTLCNYMAVGAVCSYDGCGSALPPPGQFSKLALGDYHSCGLRTDGTVACWGTGPGVGPYRCTATPDGGSQCLVDGNADAGLVQADGGDVGGPKRFIDIDASGDGTCAVRTTGAIECWGALESVPVPGEGRFAKVAVSLDQVCALTAEGSALCWGRTYGRELPAAPPGPFVSIIVNTGQACALSEDHWLRCWTTPVFFPEDWVLPPDGQFSYIVTGYWGSWGSCALDGAGGHTCWGDPDLLAASEPWPDEVFEQVAVGGGRTCGLLEDGSVLCWHRIAQR